jgi:hypothetical protein
MNRSRTYRWARRVIWGTLAVLLAVGCNPITTAGFLFHRDAKEPAVAPLKIEKKDEVVVALFVSQGSGQTYEFADAPGALASEMAKKLPEIAKENKQKIAVVASKDVNRFKMQNPNWKLMHPSEWGKKLGADFVLDIHLDKMRLYQPGMLNALYEGRAEVAVDTYEVSAGAGDPKFSYVHPFAFPKTGYRDASDSPQGMFKKQFIETLAVELCSKHIDHKMGNGIAEGP